MRQTLRPKILILVLMLPSFLALLYWGEEDIGVSGKNLTKVGGIYMELQKNDLPAAIPDVSEQTFFNFNDQAQVKLMTQLSNTSFRGVAIRAPRRIQLEDHPELPVILFSQSTGLRDWEVSFKRNSTLVAVDLSSGRIFHGHAFASPKKRDFADADLSMQGSRPNKMNAESISTGAEKLDARRLVSLPWQPSRYAVTVITHDWVSNTVIVELETRSNTVRRSPSYFSFGRAVQLNEIAKASQQANRLPSFVRTPHSPVMTTPGLMLSVPSQASLGASTIPIYGAVKTAVPLSSIVELPTLTGGINQLMRHPTAVLTGALLIIQKDVVNPPGIEVQIPVNTTQALEEGDIVEGYFGLNLVELLPKMSSEANYFVYFFLGEHFDGPHEISISGK